ncbi:metal-dependent hydrolase [Salisaeta longa]|uniref:metal-dependent hydrolase n=1 Tax=Salisaeta longa TaxID=503170 RepID=UPI0003B30495|nr:metal-dependent hydrolase [Salisaeta longa]
MAGYKGHVAGASVFGTGYVAALIYVFSINAAYQQFTAWELLAYPLGVFVLALLFGLWPDVDTDSKGQRVFYVLFFLTDLYLILMGHFRYAAYLGLFALVPAMGKHRGWTHTWWAMLLVPAPILVLPYFHMPERPLVGVPFYGAAVIGYFSHLVLDGVFPGMERTR